MTLLKLVIMSARLIIGPSAFKSSLIKSKIAGEIEEIMIDAERA